jgi:hypothetical protein
MGSVFSKTKYFVTDDIINYKPSDNMKLAIYRSHLCKERNKTYEYRKYVCELCSEVHIVTNYELQKKS